jgi:SAM-dependent methyltransferase
VGCSIGVLFEFFPEKQWKRYGVELSSTAAQYASNHYACEIFTGTLQSANYDNAQFDLVTVIDTLYYMDDPGAEIKEIKRILKPGGLIAIEIAGQAYILFRNYGYFAGSFIKRNHRAPSNSSYIYWFNPGGLFKLLIKYGLTPVGCEVIPSPKSSIWLNNLMISIHYRSVHTIYQLTKQALTWAPKYLLLARS